MTSKANDKLWRFFKTTWPIGILLITVAITYGSFYQRVNYIEKQIENVGTNKDAIIELKIDVKYIKQSVDRIERALE